MSENTAEYKIAPREPLNTLFRAGNRLESARAILIAGCHYTDELGEEYARKRFDQLLSITCEELRCSERDFHAFHEIGGEMSFKHDFGIYDEAESAFMNISAMCVLLGNTELNQSNAVGSTNVFL